MAFSKYLLAQAEKRTAYNDYCRAGTALELAQIRERLAELASQYDPIHEDVDKLGVSENLGKLIRTEILHFCRYVVTGRKDRGE